MSTETRTAVIPGASSGIGEATGVDQFYAELAIPADEIAQIIAFALSRPQGVSINEILVRPTAQAG